MSVPVARPRQTTHHATFVVLTVAVASFALLQSLVVPMLGKLQVELHTTQTTVTWVLTAYRSSACKRVHRGSRSFCDQFCDHSGF